MDKGEWIETKKECEVTETGELVTRKVTLERTNRRLEKKDKIDISLRFLGLAAIFIPLWLFFQQQQSERDKQKALFQLDLYSNTTSELHSMINRPLQSHEFELSKNKILYELYPKVVLLNDKAVIDSFRVIRDMIAHCQGVTDLFQKADTLYKLYHDVTPELPVIMNSVANLRNSLETVIHLESETPKGKNFTDRYRPNEMKTFSNVNSIYVQLVQFTEDYIADTAGVRAMPSIVDWLYESNNENKFHAVMDSLSVLRQHYPRDFITNITYSMSTLDSAMIRSNALLYKH